MSVQGEAKKKKCVGIAVQYGIQPFPVKYINIISWTFNDEKKIKCLINLGVDGIVTDKPKMLREIALSMGKILH